ncbi:ankyrin repeat-containing protein [Metarhizium album ARSEF 1941]|uniref:Ankyrin repeat-containing protein n=1 Tax=Metarhizium album (strain ARSEF 1941) TaxID=1081103 RepID=A0A0B2WM66_METAS|nr:ankyrin repeat-containing protein [Metarhizium album ARSEF 1941]KHN97151.1 ankyrin repeat-containing protein [Metarhizium album ARSEF 1941]
MPRRLITPYRSITPRRSITRRSKAPLSARNPRGQRSLPLAKAPAANTPSTTVPEVPMIVQNSRLLKTPNEIQHMIADWLSEKDLFHLAQCSTNLADIAIPKLYAADARHGNSKAILWAAKTCAARDPALALKILQKSFQKGGDVNAVHQESSGLHATALHYAAAYSRVEFVETLLSLGAHVDCWSSGAELAKDLGIPALDESLNGNFAWLPNYDEAWKWSPLVVPLLTNDTETAKLLVGAEAPATVVRPAERESFLDTMGVVTVYHMLAFADPARVADWLPILDKDVYRRAINVRMHSSSSPLHVAIRRGNAPMFDMLMDNGADPNSPGVWSGNALVTAVKAAFMIGSIAARRKTIMSWTSRLMRAGAVINPPDFSLESPLGCALEQLASTSGIVESSVSRVVEILVKAGANVNLRSRDGATILQQFCSAIFCLRPPRYPVLENILRFLIDHGGDLNSEPAPGRESIMFTSIRQTVRSKKVAPVHAILRDAGAALLPREMFPVFCCWVQLPWFRKNRVFDITKGLQHITQAQINFCWLWAVERSNVQALRALQNQRLMPTNVGQLAHVSIRTGALRVWPRLLNMGLGDVNCLGEAHGSFLHTLARRVLRQASFPDAPSTGRRIDAKKAVEMAQTCIRLGTSTLTRDDNGMLAFDLLEDSHDKLRLALLKGYVDETRDLI